MAALTAVAMSGGLDSSVAAALLVESGEPVVGLSMLLEDRSDVVRNGRCCGSLDLEDARRVAANLEIPHYTLKMVSEFEERVIEPFVAEYAAGRTPSPCVRCNTFVKFGLFLGRARRFGCTGMATGHYARIVEGPSGPELHRAEDLDKDQSYFLFELTQDQLSAARFPLGELTKPEARCHARRLGLSVAAKPESMELCFVPGGISDFLGGRIGDEAPGPAEVVDEEGRRLGEAAPYYRYTVGQRRGLGISSSRPLFVLDVDPEHNRLVVGEREALACEELVGRGLHWIGEPPTGSVTAVVKVRSRHEGVEATVRGRADGRAEISFSEPVGGVAPGQAAVFYEESRVLGGCWIEKETVRGVVA